MDVRPVPLEILRSSSVLSALPEPMLAQLANVSRVESYRPGSLLARRDETPDRLWLVLEGAIEIGFFSSSGSPSLLPPIFAGGWATWMSCFRSDRLPHDLWTGPATSLLALPVEAVRRSANDFPPLYPLVLEQVGERMRNLMGWVLASSLSDPARRMAFLLGYLAGEQGNTGDNRRMIPLTHEQLSAMGTGSRQRVGRTIKRLEAMGLVESRYGLISIPSLSALKVYAGIDRLHNEGPDRMGQ